MQALGQTTRASAKKVKAGSTRGESFRAEESRRTLNEAIDGRKIKPPWSLICELKYSCAHGS